MVILYILKIRIGDIEFPARALLSVPNYGPAQRVINAYIIIINYLSLYSFPYCYSYIVRTSTDGELVFSTH